MTATKIQESKSVVDLLGWPTDVFAIDHAAALNNTDSVSNNTDTNNDTSVLPPHTLLIFIPGNPGLVEWYIPMFRQLVESLGPGFAARGAANAGHSLNPEQVKLSPKDTRNRSSDIPWTVDGQSLHKAAFIDWLLSSSSKQQQPRLIFISHSIGMHFTHRLLLFRPDILRQTILLLGLMPFIRMDTPKLFDQILLNTAAAYPHLTVRIHQAILSILQKLPLSTVKRLFQNKMPDPVGREIAAKLVQIPSFAANFFYLGTQEIRHVPQCLDHHALEYISTSICGDTGCTATAFLFASDDKWAPHFHLNDLRQWQQSNQQQQQQQQQQEEEVLQIEFNDTLMHDFVSDHEQVTPVVEFCLRHIRRVVDGNNKNKSLVTTRSLRSRL